MRSIVFKIGQIVGFSLACLIFFNILFFILVFTKKIDFKIFNYLLILIFPLFIISSYIIYRIVKK